MTTDTRRPTPGCRRWILVAALVLIVHALVCPLAFAQPVSPNYVLTAWTAKDGLPSSNVLSMTQDLQGYLWLGTSGGLVKFDGFQFVQWHPPHGEGLVGAPVSALIAAHDGGLWVAFDGISGVSRINGNDEVTAFAAGDGPPGAVTALLEDRSHVIWAGGHGGLSVFRDAQWRALGPSDGLPNVDLFSLYEDTRGNLWAATSAGVFRKTAASTMFALLDANATFVQSFAEDRAGTVWVTDTRALARPITATERPRIDASVELPIAGWRLLGDRHGELWIAALGAGLFHIRQGSAGKAPTLTRYAYETKFVGAARSLFEDRDHNLWIGMRRGGLLRLSETPVLTEIALEGSRNDGVQALAASTDGSVWVATAHNLNQFTGAMRRTYALDQPLALFADRLGDIWVASASGVGPLSDGKVVRVPLPSAVRLSQVGSVAVDNERALWLCVYDQGLFRWSDGVLSHFDDVPGIAGRACNSLYVDLHGRVWIGYAAGGAAVFDSGTFHVYSTNDGLAPGGVVAINQSHDDVIWISTANGITRISQGRFTTLTGHGLRGNLVPSLIEDSQGFLWVGTGAGAALMRINPREFDQIAADPDHQISYTLYDESDGLQGPLARLSAQTAARGGDGRLWFVSGSGVAVIDPRTLTARSTTSAPHIDHVAMDGEDIDFLHQHVVPPHGATLQIDYSALNLSSASKLRFRYRLEGVNTRWEDADIRRRLTFMNLQPGNYRFHLGVTQDGSWTRDEAVWAFTVQAPFYRTYWFYTLACALCAVVIASGWWLRLRRIRNEFELVLAERSRLSRELHDTTLQSLGAFKLQLELAAKQLDASQNVTRETLHRLRGQVTDCIQGARRAVWELRTPALEVRGLVKAVQEAANNAVAGTSVTVRVTATGRTRRCPLRVEEHLLRISQEAISNAMRHGQATDIAIAIDYRRQAVIVSVVDNGAGFAQDDVGAGHWGLKNMQERAKEFGGQLHIDSRLHVGTTVTVSVPL